MLPWVSGVSESCALHLFTRSVCVCVCVCVCKKQSGVRGTRVETKQMSAGAGRVCDRGASEIYAGRAA